MPPQSALRKGKFDTSDSKLNNLKFDLSEVHDIYGYDYTLYNVLSIERNATASEIRAAYLKKGRDILSTYPNPSQQNSDFSARNRKQFQAITLAYEILSKEDLRALYDGKFGIARRNSVQWSKVVEEKVIKDAHPDEHSRGRTFSKRSPSAYDDACVELEEDFDEFMYYCDQNGGVNFIQLTELQGLVDTLNTSIKMKTSQLLIESFADSKLESERQPSEEMAREVDYRRQPPAEDEDSGVANTFVCDAAEVTISPVNDYRNEESDELTNIILVGKDTTDGACISTEAKTITNTETSPTMTMRKSISIRSKRAKPLLGATEAKNSKAAIVATAAVTTTTAAVVATSSATSSDWFTCCASEAFVYDDSEKRAINLRQATDSAEKMPAEKFPIEDNAMEASSTGLEEKTLNKNTSARKKLNPMYIHKKSKSPQLDATDDEKPLTATSDVAEASSCWTCGASEAFVSNLSQATEGAEKMPTEKSPIKDTGTGANSTMANESHRKKLDPMTIRKDENFFAATSDVKNTHQLFALSDLNILEEFTCGVEKATTETFIKDDETNKTSGDTQQFKSMTDACDTMESSAFSKKSPTKKLRKAMSIRSKSTNTEKKSTEETISAPDQLHDEEDLARCSFFGCWLPETIKDRQAITVVVEETGNSNYEATGATRKPSKPIHKSSIKPLVDISGSEEKPDPATTTDVNNIAPFFSCCLLDSIFFCNGRSESEVETESNTVNPDKKPMKKQKNLLKLSFKKK